MPNITNWNGWLKVAALFLPMSPVSHALEVEGRAPLSEDPVRTHALALNDALARAPNPLVAGGYTVIGEWIEGESLVIRVWIGEGSLLRPRLAIAQFHLARPGRPEGSALATTLLDKLTGRLKGGEKVVITDAGQYQLIPPTESSPLALIHDGAAVRQLAATSSAELVFSGILWDVSQNEGSWIPWKAAEIQADLEIFLHDGVTGSLLRQARIASQFLVQEGPGGLVTQLGNWIEKIIVDRPLTATVLRVEGDRIRLDASAASGLQPGMSVIITPFDPLLVAPDLADAGKIIISTNTHAVLYATVEDSNDHETSVTLRKNHFVSGDRVLVRPAPVNHPALKGRACENKPEVDQL